ncbi:ABC-type transport auxiliary lipoprotein family protein [Imhoffiella purpurea]|uniref:ABC-type transport system n=1 Tax=Imhoffiella purpurea TaxID=1249627 RepID=W9VCK0_9GAMM|nr:ABC-type transport auxiliary lipoprotein family protein [Imhoffiella purpurea]EXJ17179.1 ABC-type transport system [Imhoffiella purpurea]
MTHPTFARSRARIRFALALVFAAVFALLAGGCGSAPPIEPDHYFVLDPALSIWPAPRQVPAILLVNDLAARGFLGGREIVYRTRGRPLMVERYRTELWAEPVSGAMVHVLVGAIRQAGLFRYVAIPADRVRADYLLNGEVERFEHWPTDTPPRVAATLNLSLVAESDRRSLWARQYQGEEPVDASTPDAMAAAFNRLAARLAGEVVRDLERVQPALKAR